MQRLIAANVQLYFLAMTARGSFPAVRMNLSVNQDENNSINRKTKMKQFFKQAVRLCTILGAVIVLLSGCAAVGTDYTEPQMELPSRWNAAYQSSTDEKNSRLSSWWESLNDPVLNQLIDRAIENNLDLQEALSRIRQARYEKNISEADQYPVLDSSASAKVSGSSDSESETRLYSAGLDANWEIDVFGGVRRSVEASYAEYQAQVEDLHDVLVTLLSEVALNYVDLRMYQQQIGSVSENIEIQMQSKAITDSLLQSGLADNLEQTQAAYQLAGTKAQLPALQTKANSTMNRLSVLLGEPAGSLDELLAESSPIPVPDTAVATGIPADIIRQRPDIRQAERNLAAQTARIGVAEADLYPRFFLSGSFGLESVSSSSFFTDPTFIWSLGPSITWSVFDAGSIKNNIEVQKEIKQQYLLQYQTTVLSALEEVENSLCSLAHEKERLILLSDAVVSARKATELATSRFAAGTGDFMDVLDAQQALLTYEDQLNESKGSLSSYLVELYKSLGGGWQNLSHTDKEQS